ncbi:MAG: hypothetical protein R6V23_00170 [Bacteroidales bacterium]
MKKSTLPLLESLMPLALAVLLFMAKKQVVSSTLYVAAAVMVSFYFFPLRLFVGGYLRVPAFQQKAMRGFASVILFEISAFSGVLLFAKTGHPLYLVTLVTGLINALLLVYFVVRNDDARLSLSHFGFMLLLAAVVFV